MSRKHRSGGQRGRPAREYHIRVRTVRREEIDFAKLAQAALEQAAMDQERRSSNSAKPKRSHPHAQPMGKETHHDDLE